MSSIERSLIPHIGNKDYTNIIFKSGNNNIIRRHLESLDDIYIDWNINKIDMENISKILPLLSNSIRIRLYRHLTKRKLVILFVSLDFNYLWEYLCEMNDLSILKDIIIILDSRKYKDLYIFVSDKFRVYMYILEETGNTRLNKYLIEYFPNNFLLDPNLFMKPKILYKLLINSDLDRCRIISSTYPNKLLIDRINSVDELSIDFITLLITLGRLEYCIDYLKYIVDFTFEEMKKLVPLIYPCYIVELARCKGISYTLYLNLVEYMTHEQISFVLESSNIELYLDIFLKLKGKQLLFGCKRITEEKFWLSLKSVSFDNLYDFINGTKSSHKNIFINKILEYMDLGEVVTNLVPQYQVMCFIYRETFEYIIDHWADLQPYLNTIIFKLLDGKKILILSELCILSEWSNLIRLMSKHQILNFCKELEKISILERDSRNTCNILHFCRIYDKYGLLSHIFSVLNEN
jgi:hypothetical protein